MYWKDGHVEISVSFLILWKEEKLAKPVGRGQQVQRSLQKKMKPPEVPKLACRTLVLFLGEFKLADQAQPAETIPFCSSREGRARPLHSYS